MNWLVMHQLLINCLCATFKFQLSNNTKLRQNRITISSQINVYFISGTFAFSSSMIHTFGSNSIQCSSCQKWVHKKCSGIKGSMSKVAKSFICTGCLNPVTSAGRTSVYIGDSVKYGC